MSTQTETTCYRHPGRETRVSCSSCGRPICPDCMRPSPVGMRCPECSSQTTKVKTLASVGGEPRATIALIAICSIVFLAEGSFGVSGGQGSLFRDGALFGPAVAAGDWWRLVTYGFLHAGLLHIGFNMLLLWLFGREMEPQLGTPIFLGIYFSCLLAGRVRRAGLLAGCADGRGVGRDLRPDGRGRGDPLRTGREPVPDRHRDADRLQPRAELRASNVSVGGHVGGLVGGMSAASRSRAASAAAGGGSAGPESRASRSCRYVGAEFVARSAGYGGLGL